MKLQKHNKNSIIQTLKNLAKKSGKKELSLSEIRVSINPSAIRYHFGSVKKAVEAAGLKYPDYKEQMRERKKQARISDEQLFHSMLAVEKKLRREPRYSDYMGEGKYSAVTFRKRFGKWDDVLAQYRKWKGLAPHENKQDEVVAADTKESLKDSSSPGRALSYSTAKINGAQRNYGEPLTPTFRGLKNAPINEQGVVFLFGMISRELGFLVESIQQGFPDCEAEYLYEPRRKIWRKARIEFEYRASEFKKHNHDPNNCDFIVCWIDDWGDNCPIEVIELRKELPRLKSD